MHLLHCVHILEPAPSVPVRPCLADINLVKALEGNLVISASKLKLKEMVGRGGQGLLDMEYFP